MNIHVFSGPTISQQEILNISEEILVHPPVKQGDIYNLVQKQNSIKKIGIIDGFFEVVPSVMHKEIMYAMTQDIKVYGASSMGALRASELFEYGMIGIGYVFEQYLNGFTNDDDEVTISHAPSSLDYMCLSDALVNIRFTIEKALENDIISEKFAKLFLFEAKNIFYKDRSYPKTLGKIKDLEFVNEKKVFSAWLSENAIDIKKEDAKAMLRIMILDQKQHDPQIFLNNIFQDTKIWKKKICL